MYFQIVDFLQVHCSWYTVGTKTLKFNLGWLDCSVEIEPWGSVGEKRGTLAWLWPLAAKKMLIFWIWSRVSKVNVCHPNNYTIEETEFSWWYVVFIPCLHFSLLYYSAAGLDDDKGKRSKPLEHIEGMTALHLSFIWTDGDSFISICLFDSSCSAFNDDTITSSTWAWWFSTPAWLLIPS